MPQDSRTKPGGVSSPHCARRSAVVCRPPNEVAANTSRRRGEEPADRARRAQVERRRRPGSGASARRATAYAGSSGRPGQRTPVDVRIARRSSSATAAAFAVCRASRRSSVASDRCASQASNGPGIAAGLRRATAAAASSSSASRVAT